MSSVVKVKDHAKAQPVTRDRSVSQTVLTIVERYALLGLVILVFVFFSVLPETSSTFPSIVNIRQVLSSQSALVVIAIAEVFPLLLGAFDLSVGSVCTLSAVVCATSMSRFGLPLGVSVLLALFASIVVGLVNAFAVAQLKLTSIVITLGTSVLLTGLVTWYTAGNNISTGISQYAVNFGSKRWLGVPRVLFVVLIVVLGAWYLFKYTRFGRYVHAIGSNTRAANLVGINVPRQTAYCFVASSTLSGLAGILTVAIDGGAIISEGAGYLFPALTAVFLGATVITIGRYNVIGTVIGVVFVAASVSGLTLAGAASWVNDVFNGSALIVAVAIATGLSRRRAAQSIISAGQGGL